MRKELNPDWRRRNWIIWGEDSKDMDWSGGIQKFTISLNQLDDLFKEEFIDPEETQNDSPMAIQFRDFMEDHVSVLAHGYAVSPNRDDYRVTIEGLVYHGEVDDALMFDFIDEFRFADEFLCDREKLYCWWN